VQKTSIADDLVPELEFGAHDKEEYYLRESYFSDVAHAMTITGPALPGLRPVYISTMLVTDFEYHLPPELIAQEPAADRAGARMLYLMHPRDELDKVAEGAAHAGSATLSRAPAGSVRDTLFREFPDLLRPDDLVVFNNTRVFPARLFGRRSGSRAQPLSPQNPASKEFLKGRTEVLLTRAAGPNRWQALVRPGRKIGIGERIRFGEHDELEAEVVARGEFGERTLQFDPVPDFFDRLERIGHIPLPPYIGRDDRASDRERYQTVFARDRGSVAAPTAGLHFTPEILDRIHARGIETCEITLHVGLGTFQPVREAKVEDNRLHTEHFRVPDEAARQISDALAAKRRIVAVGTTTVRTLEYCAMRAGESRVDAGEGEADIFIYPGFRFRIVGALLTNFHLPQSTLLMLVSAFAGRERVLRAYAHAVASRYRFYSYGDCMFIE
jgi:S-adenosylmethionine:tRNA ribosyltransferase-isomerase